MNNFYDLWDDPEARLPSHVHDSEWAAIEAEQRAEHRVITLRMNGEILLATVFSAVRAEYDRAPDADRLCAVNDAGRRLFAYRVATRRAAGAAARRARVRAINRA